VAYHQWVEGAKAPTNCPEAIVLGAPHIAKKLDIVLKEYTMRGSMESAECKPLSL